MASGNFLEQPAPALQGQSILAPEPPAPATQRFGSISVTTPEERADAQTTVLPQQAQQVNAAELALQQLPDVVRQTSGTNTVRKALLSPTDAARQEAELAARQEQGQESRQSIQAQLQFNADRAEQVGQEAAARLRANLEGLGQRAPALRKQVEQAQKEFRQLKQEVLSVKADPQRLTATMPSWAQALTVIATSFDQLGRTFGGARTPRGPSVFNIVQAAMARDFQQQRQAMQARMVQLGIAERGQNQALARLGNLQAQQAQQANTLTKVQLANLATQDQSLTNQLNVVRELGQFQAAGAKQALQLKELSTDQVTRSFTSRSGANTAKIKALQELAKQRSKPVKLSTPDQKLLQSGVETTALLDDAVQLLQKAAPEGGGVIGQRGLVNTLFGLAPFTDEGQFKAAQGRLNLSIKKELSGANATDAEERTIGRSEINLFDSPEQVGRKLRMKRDVMGKVFRKHAVTLAGRGDTAAARVFIAQAADREAIFNRMISGYASKRPTAERLKILSDAGLIKRQR